ncbi:hypothetical protein [Vibrio sp. 1CM23M]|uniref:hypothetical protein n=1 Tax=Vibrio sp. 1CM23M TaxID=2929164 RepID=UPI0020BE321D|nr:hypothetical protein [Vibrio sp. 1CM23M]MCK8072458.1 hypothetical protein [Vibrio sp. 1CM23M]
MKYDLFKTKTQTLFSNKKIMRSLKKMFGKTPSFEELLIQDTELAAQLDDTLGINTNAEELFFDKTGRKLVFVEKSVVEMLNRAKFTSNSSAKILPPAGFETFALCFEKDTFVEVNGKQVRLYPCQITVMEEEEMYQRIHQPFGELTGFNIQRNPSLNLTITVSYKIDDVTYRSCVDIREVMNKIDTGVRESNELSSILDQRLNDTEQLTTNTLMKIAVQLLIFNSATNNKHLVSGFPSDCDFRLPLNTTRVYWTASHIDYSQSKAVSAHIRSAHFRNLQHPKYYNNEYSNIPKGSRWVLVSESFIGDNDTFIQQQNI